MFVCDINNRDCMTVKCHSCPGASGAKSYLAKFMVKKCCEDEI